jgi:hypothetical protein
MNPSTCHELWDLTRDLTTGKVLKMERLSARPISIPTPTSNPPASK